MALEKKNGGRRSENAETKFSNSPSVIEEKNRIKDSLQKLNAAAKNKQQEISTVLGMKYEDVKQKVYDAKENGKIRIGLAKIKTTDAIHNGSQKVKEAASLCNNTVHNNPWPILGGVALAGFGVGLIVMSQVQRKKSRAAAQEDAEIVPIPGNRPVTKSARAGSTARQSSGSRGI